MLARIAKKPAITRREGGRGPDGGNEIEQSYQQAEKRATSGKKPLKRESEQSETQEDKSRSKGHSIDIEA